MNTGRIDRTIVKALDMVEKLEKLFANNGAFENAVLNIGGDISYFGDVRRKLVALYGGIEDLHMGAIGHMDESVTESVKLTEGVLDGDDEDGFMARSQLYFLAKDAISLHGMISDRDNLEPWVQSKITTAANDIEAVRRYTEYNQQQADRQLPVPAEEPDMEMEEGWESMPAIDAERYGPRDGLEGPFQTRVGKVVYYDPKAGKYYDPDSDHYLEYDEWRQLDKPGTPLRNEETSVNEDIRSMPDSRLKWHMNTGVPHGRYTKAELKAEKERRLKFRDSADAYKQAKPALEGAGESIAEGKKKQIDRNGDGKNDWEDVKLARKAAAAKAQKKPVEESKERPSRFAFINNDEEIEIWDNIANRHIRSIPMQNKQSAIRRLEKANYEASLDTFAGKYQIWYMNTEDGVRISDYDQELEEAMNFDDNRDGDLKQIAADMFSHAKKAAAKKVK